MKTIVYILFFFGTNLGFSQCSDSLTFVNRFRADTVALKLFDPPDPNAGYRMDPNHYIDGPPKDKCDTTFNDKDIILCRRKYFTIDRNPQLEGEFKEPQKSLWNGKWYVYNNDGILLRIEVYKNGCYVGLAVIGKDY